MIVTFKIKFSCVFVSAHVPVVVKYGTVFQLTPVAPMGISNFLMMPVRAYRVLLNGNNAARRLIGLCVVKLKVVERFHSKCWEKVDIRSVYIKIFVVIFKSAVSDTDRNRRKAVKIFPDERRPDNFEPPVVAIRIIDVPRIELGIVCIKLHLRAFIHIVVLCNFDARMSAERLENCIQFIRADLVVANLITQDRWDFAYNLTACFTLLCDRRSLSMVSEMSNSLDRLSNHLIFLRESSIDQAVKICLMHNGD